MYQKANYDVYNKRYLNADGTALGTSSDNYPGITLTQKQIFNLQLVNGAITTKYHGISTGQVATFNVDNDWNNTQIVAGLPNDYWTNTSGSEYSHYIPVAPSSVTFDGVAATLGTAGSLTAGQYAYDETNKKIIVRLADSASPATKDDDYVLVTIVNSSGTPLALFAGSDVFNLSNSWYDTTTSTWRNPVITDGELSWSLNGNTVDFYSKILAKENIDAIAQIKIYAIGTGALEDTIKLPHFILRNILDNGDTTQLEITGINFYNKEEVDSKLSGKIDKDFSGYDAKTALADADSFAINDSADLNAPKKTLWSSVKSTLKTYLDALYAPIASSTMTLSAGASTTLSLGSGSRYLVDLYIDDGTYHYFEGLYSVIATGAGTAEQNDKGHATSSTPLVEFDPDNSVGSIAAVNSSGTLGLTFTLAAGTDRTLNYKILAQK